MRGARHELEPPIAELDDRDRGEEGALPGGVGVDVALDERRRREAGVARSSSSAMSSARASSHRPQSGAAVQDEVGEGSVGHLALGL